MENNPRFNELLNRYLDDKATPEEYDELMKLIHEGANDETVKDRIDAILANDAGVEDMNRDRAQAILSTIINSEKESHNREFKIVPFKALRWVAAAAVILLAVTVILWKPDPLTPTSQDVSKQENSDQSVFAGKQLVHLPDGSTVILNEGSELRYSSSFGEHLREVTLIGEGFFDIQHDPSRPFKVLTGEITTTVLGTAFNVRAYPGQDEVEVTVTRGKVQVNDATHVLGVITPDQQIAVNTETDEFVQANVNAEESTAWVNRYVIFDDVTMETAAKMIGERYNTKVLIDNSAIGNCRITATFLNGENIDQVLTVVCGVINAEYEKQPDGSVRIDGEGCK